MPIKPNLLLLGLLALTAIAASAQTSTLSDSQWKGTYASGTSANTPATLQVVSKGGSLTGTLTYDGWEETVAITSTAPRAFRIKGVSYRDTRGGRRFFLDTFNAQLSADGRSLNATGGDTNSVVANSWLKLQKVDSTAGTAPQPVSPSLAKSLIGSSWEGGIAESQKGSMPAQLRISAVNAILDYDQFEEVLSVTLAAPSNIQMRGTSYRDLGNQGRRSFTLDNLQGQISSDGHTIDGVIDGRHFDFHRTN